MLNGIRHSSLYLADGNLIVAAPISEGDGGMMLFRVHQSMLSLQSPVFAAMFTLPSPDTNRDIYDGVPFVRMPDDARDIESLLKVLYNPSALPYKRLDPLTPINVRRTLAMATKYEMDGLRDRIVTQLQADWPQSLVEWDRLETEIRCLEEEHESAEDDDYMVDDLYLDERLPEPAAAIRLAMDWNVPKIMPSAVYHLSRLKTSDDWLERHQSRTNLYLDRTARWDLLEAPDLKLVLKVREILTSFYYFPLHITAGSCDSETCDDQWRKTYCQWQVARDPLDLMKKFVDTRPRDLCKHCWKNLRESVQQCRFKVWDKITDCVQVSTSFTAQQPLT
ncbi:hypothetical protein B0H12DRAFT_1029079 [Mycena haematopus]|nr:hypothetical protein B0H12DRAFT_1029079 [Mycena haematopus]